MKQGGLDRRLGSRMLAEVKNSAKDTILIPFEPNTVSLYMLEVGDLYIRMFRDKAILYSDANGDGVELIVNGTFPVNLASWTVTVTGTGAVIQTGGVCQMTPGAAGTARIAQSFATVVGRKYRISIRNLVNKYHVKVGTSENGTQVVADTVYGTTTTTTLTSSFVATATTTWLTLLADTTLQTQVDDISVQLSIQTEIVSPYTEAQLRNIHFTQSVDVMNLFNSGVAQQKLSRLADTNWVIAPVSYIPPATIEDDTDISGGSATLTPGATSGNNITMTASSGVFLAGDVGRLIIAGTAKATIITFTSTTVVRADIIDNFPNTNPIQPGSWLMRLTPQVSLNPNVAKPVNGYIQVIADKPCFRVADVGKYIKLLGGVIKITKFNTNAILYGQILTILSKAIFGLVPGTTNQVSSDPLPAPAGTWTLEAVSWSATKGYPRSGDYFEGRLVQCGNLSQPTTFWASASDGYENYGKGEAADDALDYTPAARLLAQLEWVVDNVDLFLGSSTHVFRVKGADQDKPLGGDQIPLVKRITGSGVGALQPTVVDHRVIFVDKTLKQIFHAIFNLEEDGFEAVELTAIAEHITGTTGIRLGPVAFSRRPHPRIHWVRSDGQMVTLTYYHKEKVIGFTRYVTDGTYESVGVKGQTGVGPDHLWAIVKRTIAGATKRYIEIFDEDTSEMAGRQWTSVQTDCAKLFTLGGSQTVFAVPHLALKTVDLIADGVYVGTAVVNSAGNVTSPTPATTTMEIGLHYDSTFVTMRPAIDGQVAEGLPRQWIKIWVRLYKSLGGKAKPSNGAFRDFVYANNNLYTGDKEITPQSSPDTDGRITVVQNKPYPMTLLAIFGEVQFSDHG